MPTPEQPAGDLAIAFPDAEYVGRDPSREQLFAMCALSAADMLEFKQGRRIHYPLFRLQLFFREHEREVLRRWFQARRWGTRPAFWWHCHRPPQWGCYRIEPGETELQALTRLGVLNERERAMLAAGERR